MLLRWDPTRTGLLRRQWETDLRRRFGGVRKEVEQLILGDDAFGLVPGVPFVLNVERQAWRFLSNEKKLEQFRKWLEELVERKILTTDAVNGQPWTAKYVESAWKKGVVRAFVDARGRKLQKTSDFFEGTKAEFLRAAFAQPERLAKVRVLATRAFESLRGVTQAMGTQMNRILATGIIQGQNPKQIAAEMSKSIRGLTKARALAIARTEIIHAHAEGQLDSFEDLGEDVGVLAEWSTAGDDRVCSQCAALEGAVFTIEEARGKLPRHPNCRCAWIPADEVNLRTRKGKLQRAVRKSIKGDKRSRWAGRSLARKKKARKK